LHFSDDSKTNFLIRLSTTLEECFIITPCPNDENKSIVYLYTSSPSLTEDNYSKVDFLIEKRIKYMTDLKSYCSLKPN